MNFENPTNNGEQKKNFGEMNRDEIKTILMAIRDSAKTEEQIRSDIISKLDYPYGNETIVISQGHQDLSGKLKFEILIKGPNGTTIDI